MNVINTIAEADNTTNNGRRSDVPIGRETLCGAAAIAEADGRFPLAVPFRRWGRVMRTDFTFPRLHIFGGGVPLPA
jgi:hypothetical protein